MYRLPAERYLGEAVRQQLASDVQEGAGLRFRSRGKDGLQQEPGFKPQLVAQQKHGEQAAPLHAGAGILAEEGLLKTQGLAPEVGDALGCETYLRDVDPLAEGL